MRKRVILIDASKVLIKQMDDLFAEVLPNVEVLHLVDEGIIPLMKEPSKLMARRLSNLVISAEQSGVDIILITAACAIPFMDLLKSLIDVPLMIITQPMIDVAVEKANTVGVVAMEKPVAESIVALIEKAAHQKSKKISIKVTLCEEAFTAFVSGDNVKYEKLISEVIMETAKSTDVVTLAHVSMAGIAPKIQDRVNRPILTVPRIAVEKIKAMLT